MRVHSHTHSQVTPAHTTQTLAHSLARTLMGLPSHTLACSYMQSHAHTCTRTHLCTRTHVCAHSHALTCTHTRLHALVHAHVHSHTHSHALTRARTLVHSYTCSHTHSYEAIPAGLVARLPSSRLPAQARWLGQRHFWGRGYRRARPREGGGVLRWGIPAPAPTATGSLRASVSSAPKLRPECQGRNGRYPDSSPQGTSITPQ